MPPGDTPLPTRRFGRHPDEFSIIGVGGGHLSRSSVGEREAIGLIRAAVDAGVTFMDTAWDYGYGASEERMGRALQGRRGDVFLMTKVCARDAPTARRQLDESLRRLRVDCVDLWQFHEINYDNDPSWIFEAGGAVEAALEARAQGKVRYVGFTGHKSPHILQAMLDMDAEWDSCQMPISPFDGAYRSFAREILPTLTERGIACLGMKSLGGNGQFVGVGGLTAQDCRRYALSQPIATLVCGMLDTKDLAQDVEIARTFTPMGAEEQARLLRRIHREATDGRHEYYKSTTYFDHEYHRAAHGFPAFAEIRNR